jgi:hypothetical protein
MRQIANPRRIAVLGGPRANIHLDPSREENLAGPLEAAAAMLKSEANAIRLDLTAQALENFVQQMKRLPDWQLDPAVESHLIRTASTIRGQLTESAPLEVVATRHSRSQTM